MTNLKDAFDGDMRAYKSLPFWSWNDNLKPEELRRQIRSMKDVGIGGFFMHARGGLETEYLGEDWFACTKACIDEAKKLGMNAWAYDENGWPSGFAGMKLLEDESNWAHFLEFKECEEFDTDALAVFVRNGDVIFRVKGPLKEVKSYINVYDKVNGSVVDICNPEIVKKFIMETHEKYYERFGESFGTEMLGFFTDEPQYFRWGTAYTPVMLDEYKRIYGEDLLDNISAILIDCEGAAKIRYRYWKLINKLYTESFIKQIFEWCEEHNCMVTGHSIEESFLGGQMWCCAGIMPFYEYQQIPGIDWLGRNIGNAIPPRQVFSVASQLGKKQILTETFACTGWDVTPKELKRIAEWQYVNGVNLMCQHLYGYSIRGQRKRDYPQGFSEHTPWYGDDFKYFNDYFTKLGFMLAESQEAVNVGVLHPIRSTYPEFVRDLAEKRCEKYDVSLAKTSDMLGERQIMHHFIDETILERHGRIDGKSLVIGNCRYDYLVFPELLCIDANTDNVLRKFVAAGGKILLCGNAPALVEGDKCDTSYLKSNVTIDEIADDQMIKFASVEALDIGSAAFVRSTTRKSEFGDFLYIVNLSETVGAKVKFSSECYGFEEFDFDICESSLVECSLNEGISTCELALEPYESAVLFINYSDEKIYNQVKESRSSEIPVLEFGDNDKEFEIIGMSENALTLDYARYSLDGCEFGDLMPVPAVFETLLNMRFSGKVYIKYEFNVKGFDNNLFAECENMNISGVWLNGEKVIFDLPGKKDRSFLRCDIAKKVRTGMNEIVFEINYHQSKHVYDVMLDNVDGTESLRNCLSFDTEIESMYITGDFGVYSECGFKPGNGIAWVSEGDFYIDKLKRKVDASNLTIDGLTFFAGEVVLETKVTKTFDINNSGLVKVRLGGRYAVAKVFLNPDENVKGERIIFGSTCVVNGWKNGEENVVRIKLSNGNRNLLGAHHFVEDEPHSVWPQQFSMEGTWKDGKSNLYKDRYAFVRFGI